MTDWKAIQQDYIAGGDSIATLAKKYGVNINTCRYHFRNERWSEKRQEARRLADEIMIETAAEHRAKIAALMDEASMKLLENISAILDHHRTGGYTKLIQNGESVSVIFDLLKIVKAITSLARIYGIDAASQLERQRLDLLKLNPEYYSGEPGPAIVISTAPDRDMNEILKDE